MKKFITEKVKKLFMGDTTHLNPSITQKMIIDRVKELASEGMREQGPMVMPALGRFLGYLLYIVCTVVVGLVLPLVAIVVLMFNDKDFTFGDSAKQHA